MKKLSLIFLTALLLLPQIASAAIAVPWTATSTDKGYITPNLVNGYPPWLYVNNAVGIGTTRPTEVNANSRLTVANTGAIDIIASTTDNTTLSTAIIEAYAPGARTFLGAHGTNQISTQYGITVGGWSELGAINSSSGTNNGLLIGTRTNATPIVFGTNSLERLRVDSTGLIGVGSTTPGYNLSIGGLAGGTTNVFGISTSTSGFATSTALQVSSLGNLHMLNGTGIDIGFGIAPPINGLLVLGNTGIATTSAIAPLYIAGTNLLAVFGNTQNTANSYISFAPGTSANAAGSSRALFGYDFTNNNAVVQGGAAKGIEFNVNNGTFGSGAAGVFTSAGNFGIATSSPASLFTVQGAGGVFAFDGTRFGIYPLAAGAITGAGGINFTPGAGTVQLGITGFSASNIASIFTASGSQKTLQIGNTSAGGFTTLFNNPTLTGTNFVGINATSTPTGLLSIAGSAGGTTPLLMISTSTSGFATSTVFYIDPNGSVAIGSSTAVTTLDVQGPRPQITVGGTVNQAGNIQFRRGNGPITGFVGWDTASTLTVFDLLSNSGGGEVRVQQNSTNGFVTLYAGPTETARVTYPGYFGIGTTTPQWKLQIATSSVSVNFRPQLTLSDSSSITNDHWSFANINGNFYLSTSSPTTFATSTAASTISIIPGGVSGLLGIGTSTPWRALDVNGTVGFKNLTTSSGLQSGVLCLSANNEVINDSVACLASSKRFKQDIAPLSDSLSEVLKLTPVSFKYTDAFNGNLKDNPNYNGPQIGFIAEDVQKVDPRLIVLDESKNVAPGTPYSVRYEQMTALLAGAIQEQEKKIDALKSNVPVRSIEENWQNLLIGLLFLYVFYNEFTKRRK